MELRLPNSWHSLLPNTEDQTYDALTARAAAGYGQGTVYPPAEQVFAAFALTPPEAVRVVILGQDPYHEPGQANGLAFSVAEGIRLPPSLLNIYKERESDVGVPVSQNGDLSHWARQGVFLLNSVLTVEHGKANSHRDLGWQEFTDCVVSAIGQLPQPVSFILWGAQAQKKAAAARNSPYPRLVLESPHPSPLSAYRGFFGSRPFSRVNAFLKDHGEEEISW